MINQPPGADAKKALSYDWKVVSIDDVDFVCDI